MTHVVLVNLSQAIEEIAALEKQAEQLREVKSQLEALNVKLRYNLATHMGE